MVAPQDLLSFWSECLARRLIQYASLEATLRDLLLKHYPTDFIVLEQAKWCAEQRQKIDHARDMVSHFTMRTATKCEEEKNTTKSLTD